MKKLLITVVLFTMFMALPARVFAFVETANAAAQLTANSSLDKNAKDNRAKRLKGFLESYKPRILSPLVDEADFIVAEADRYNVDWRLVTAIAGVESTFCQFIPKNSYNCWGWGIPTGAKSGIGFANYKDGITEVTKGLREKYLDKGNNTIEKIGRVYAASPAWSWKVKFFLTKIDDFNISSLEETVIEL